MRDLIERLAVLESTENWPIPVDLAGKLKETN